MRRSRKSSNGPSGGHKSRDPGHSQMSGSSQHRSTPCIGPSAADHERAHRANPRLICAVHAISKDLPLETRKRRHWLRAGERVADAAETGSPRAIQAAIDALLEALEHEGWMTRQIRDERE